MTGKRSNNGWWLLLAGMFLLLFGNWARSAAPILAGAAADAFDFRRALITSLGAASLLTYLGILLGGPLIDRYGPRRPVQAGVALLGVGLLLVGLARSPSLMWLAYALVGLGAGVALTAGPHTAVAHRFLQRRSLAMGLLVAAAALAPLLRPATTSAANSGAWQSAAIVSGIVLLIAGVLLSGLFRRTAAPPAPGAAAANEFSFRAAIKTRTLGLLTLGGAIATSAPLYNSMLTTRFVAVLGPASLRAGQLATLSTVHVVVMGLTAVLFGYLGDRHSKNKLMAISAVLQAAGFLLSAFASQAWQLYIVTALASVYGVLPLLFAIRADYFGLRAFASIAVVTQLLMTAIGAYAQVLLFLPQGRLAGALLLLIAAGLLLAAKPPGLPRRSAVPGLRPAL